MKRANLVAGVALFFLAVYLVISGLSLGYTENHIPGPGFVPLWVGVCLAVLSVGILWENKAESEEDQFLDKKSLSALVTTAAAAVICVVATRFLGFLLSLAGLAGFLMYRFGGTWKETIITTLAVAVTFYVLFVKFLMMNFPTGILGI